MPKIEHKYMRYEEICHHVAECLKVHPDGTSVGSVRGLMKQFGVSQSTVYRALEELKKDKLIDPDLSEGIRASHYATCEKQIHRIMVLRADTESEFCVELTQELWHVAREMNMQLIMPPFAYGGGALDDDVFEHSEGAIIIPNEEMDVAAGLEHWRKTHFPVLLLDRDLSQTGVDSVCANNTIVGMLAARHLVEQGHVNLAIIRLDSPMPTLRDRIQGFMAEVALHEGVKARVIRIDSPKFPVDADAMTLVKDALADKQTTGLFTLTHRSSQQVLSCLYRLGLHVPDDVSVVGVDNFASSQHMCPPLTTVDQRLDIWAQKAINHLHLRITGKKPDSDMANLIIPKLVIRQSTAPVSA